MNLSNVRILIVGPCGSGKSTFTMMLRNELGCCPWFDIGDALMMYLARVRVGSEDSERVMAELAYIRKHKDSFRSDLIALADVLREIDPAGLIHHGFTKAPIVASVRKRMELDAYCKDGRKPRVRGSGYEFLIELCRENCAPDNYDLAGCHSDPWKYFTATMQIPNNGDIDDLRKWVGLASKSVRSVVEKW